MSSTLRVTKTASSPYGRTKLPASGHVSRTPQGNLRITPRATSIPAAALVEWDDGEVTWERLNDLHRRRYSKEEASE